MVCSSSLRQVVQTRAVSVCVRETRVDFTQYPERQHLILEGRHAVQLQKRLRQARPGPSTLVLSSACSSTTQVTQIKGCSHYQQPHSCLRCSAITVAVQRQPRKRQSRHPVPAINPAAKTMMSAPPVSCGCPDLRAALSAAQSHRLSCLPVHRFQAPLRPVPPAVQPPPPAV